MNAMRRSKWLFGTVIALAFIPVHAWAQRPAAAIDVDKARVVAFWTLERQRAAIPRDLVIDSRGLGYLRRPDGTLVPYGHRVEAEDRVPAPAAKPGGGGGGGTKSNAEWTTGGAVQKAAGRLLFQMDVYYVCSGTVVSDATSGRSIILTAAHCVYDDQFKAFATNVMFIPDQAHTTSGETDFDCANDPLGCWVPSFGAVDVNWTVRVFPDNIAWDYAYYVVDDVGAHSPPASENNALDASTWAGSLPVSFNDPRHDVRRSSVDFTHALGYSYSYDPKFMYCAEDMTTNGSANWWLSRCGLSGGSSGGPWVQPMDTGSGAGPIISVNSWGYISGPGMAGPKLVGTSAACVFAAAKGADLGTADGVSASCP